LSTSEPAARALISGRKAFQRPMEDGIKLLNTIQDVYLCKEVTIA
jgi:fructose-bisphosphate aldolase, class I